MNDTKADTSESNRGFGMLSYRNGRLVIWLGWLTFLASLCVPLVNTDFRYNQSSDLYYLPVLAMDTMEWGGKISEWMLTPAPYYFPDMAIYLPLYWFTRNPHASQILAGVVQSVFFTGGWALLCRFISVSRQNRFAAHASVLLLSASVMTFFSLRELSIWPLQITLHFGVVACMPWVLLLAFACLSTQAMWKKVLLLCLLFLLVSVLTASDALTICHVAAPLCASLVFLSIFAGTAVRQVFAAILTIAAGAILGLFLTKLAGLHTLTGMYLSQQCDFTVSLSAIRDFFQDWMIKQGVPAFLGILAFLLNIFVAGISIRRAGRLGQAGKGLALVSSFVSFGIILGMISVFSAGNFTGIHELRYVLPLLYIPLFATPALLACVVFPEKEIKGLYAGAAMLFAVIFALNLGPLSRMPELIERYSDFYPEFAQWLDRETSGRNLTCGISDYWDAKYLTLLTKKHVRLIQSTTELEPRNWISNTKWYDRYFPDFILCTTTRNHRTRISERKVIERFGPPDERIYWRCIVMLVYRPETHPDFHEWLKNHPCRVSFRKAGDKASFDASEFPGLTGHVEGRSRVAETPGDLMGFLTYGYHFTLPAGSYQVTVAYTAAPETMAEPAGKWEITTPAKEKSVIIDKGTLDPSSKEIKSIIKLQRDQSIEIRTGLCGRGRIAVHKIGVERLR